MKISFCFLLGWGKILFVGHGWHIKWYDFIGFEINTKRDIKIFSMLKVIDMLFSMTWQLSSEHDPINGG